MNLSNKLKELRILAESGRAPHIVAYHPENQCFEMVAKEETIIKMCECIEEMKSCLEKRKDDSLHGYYGIKTREKEVLEKWFG